MELHIYNNSNPLGTYLPGNSHWQTWPLQRTRPAFFVCWCCSRFQLNFLVILLSAWNVGQLHLPLMQWRQWWPENALNNQIWECSGLIVLRKVYVWLHVVHVGHIYESGGYRRATWWYWEDWWYLFQWILPPMLLQYKVLGVCIFEFTRVM